MFARFSTTRTFMTLALSLLFAIAGAAQSPATKMPEARVEPIDPEQRAAQYLETIRQSPSQLWAFLLKMPKGGDLHNHLSGSIYAESYILWAAEKGLCVNNQTMTLTMPQTKSVCDLQLNQVPANAALTNSVLFQQLVDAWSMRNWELSPESGHDHFFNAFGRFGTATWNHTGRMLAEAVTRAAHGNVLYLELMLTPDGTMSSDLGKQVGWDGNVRSTLDKLKTSGIEKNAAVGIKALKDAETQKDQLLKCGTPQADPGCAVTVRYIAQVSRGNPS